MKPFVKLYDKTLSYAKHPNSERYLAFFTFLEAIIFPIPPDCMLAPMVLAKPKSAFRLALITTVCSILGACLGYLLGLLAFVPIVEPMITYFELHASYQRAVLMFQEYGFFAILIAGFTPIPYKVFTLSAGMLNYPFIPFIVASIISRGLRFTIVAFLVKLGGDKLQHSLRSMLDRVGLGITAVLLLGAVTSYVLYR